MRGEKDKKKGRKRLRLRIKKLVASGNLWEQKGKVNWGGASSPFMVPSPGSYKEWWQGDD